MSSDEIFQTDRLSIRRWRDTDLKPFAGQCADREVMRFFPNTRSEEECAASIARAKAAFEKDRMAFCPVVLKDTGEFTGIVGLGVPNFEKPVHFTPCVEIGWRLGRKVWGRGYAPEAAIGWLRYGFETLGLSEIVAMTVPANEPSQRVMQKIGMTRDPDGDFLHPAIDPDHRLAKHVLYRISVADWRRRQSA